MVLFSSFLFVSCVILVFYNYFLNAFLGKYSLRGTPLRYIGRLPVHFKPHTPIPPATPRALNF
jgi:hypothetical protein